MEKVWSMHGWVIHRQSQAGDQIFYPQRLEQGAAVAGQQENPGRNAQQAGQLGGELVAWAIQDGLNERWCSGTPLWMMIAFGDGL